MLEVHTFCLSFGVLGTAWCLARGQDRGIVSVPCETPCRAYPA